METSRRIQCGSVRGSSYEILVAHDILKFIPKDIMDLVPASKYIIISDVNVYRLHGKSLIEGFESHGVNPLVKVLNAGESTKCRTIKAEVEDWLLLNRCHRDSCMIALGGGVIGDLVGFIAATYMRGIPFIQIPTSLLACVDSSIGGKTGIDCGAGKNLIGAFHQPKRVYVDLQVLKTLPKREFQNGMAEIIKAGAIKSEELFHLLEEKVNDILNQECGVLLDMVSQAIQIKAETVTEDEKEYGIRAILNFGHSIGHGLEALLQPNYLHGECVAIGMSKEAEVARLMGFCSSPTVGRLNRCIKSYGLPLRIPDQVCISKVLQKMEIDKKNKNGLKHLNILKRIGCVHSNPFTLPISDDMLKLVMEMGIQVVPGQLAQGKLRVPGSKSISNRVLLLAALGKGTCRITGLLHSDDTQVMINSLQKFGAKFEWENNGDVLVVHGMAGKFQPLSPGDQLYLSNAGTAARFLTTCATLANAPQHQQERFPIHPIVLTGNSRMQERPIGALVEALRNHGCHIDYLKTPGCPPLNIYPTGLNGGVFHLEGKISSQFVSSVLLSAPYAKESITLQLAEEHPTSLPYILMTTSLMAKFGIQVQQQGLNSFVIPTGIYVNPANFDIEVDASSATYPLAMAAITGGEVTVEGMGWNSLQGDSDFHTLLKSMNCETIQTETTTTVKRKLNQPLVAVEVNMENMTDAFMTAAVLGVVAKGTTKITGIANQRVKECNRIQVMVTELSKLGVQCGELDDGIWIQGVENVHQDLHGATIACHNDHRIAMSFAVLGCVVPNIVISDKECTEKTYPEFWDDCQTKLGLEFQPISMKRNRMTTTTTTTTTEASCFFIVGMRGVGKSTVGRIAAQFLGYTCLDMDHLLEEKKEYLGCTIKQYVLEKGWSAFRQMELQLLQDLLALLPQKTLIVCGGGIVETPKALELLETYPYVIHMQRDFQEIQKVLLNQENNRPSLGQEDLSSIWERRKPLYASVSKYDFFAFPHDHQDHQQVQQRPETAVITSRLSESSMDLVHLIRSISSSSCQEFQKRMSCQNTFFLSLTFPDVSVLETTKREILNGVDALELRVDLLKSYEPTFILSQLACLRRCCNLPIIFTVRSIQQGGTFPDDESSIFALLQLGIRSGCEFVDMECCWSQQAREHLLQTKQTSKIIASYHAIHSPTSNTQIEQLVSLCSHEGQADLVKVVIRAYHVEDSYRLHQVIQSIPLSVPAIGLCTTEKGKLSRVLNPILTPVTHPLLPLVAAPGQMSVVEIMQMRKTLGILQEKKFYLFGNPIQQSPSPAMHNAAFQACHFPYTYSLCETEDVELLVQLLNSSEDDDDHHHFGGASVTIPHKLALLSHVDQCSEHVQAIGALNTLIVKEIEEDKVWTASSSDVSCPKKKKKTRFIYADNTDWIGILRPIEARLLQLSKVEKSLPALVVGAGGTSMAACYALERLGLTTVIYNRTFQKAQQIAQKFSNCSAIPELTSTHLDKICLVISTIPSSASFTLPDYLFHPKLIVMDVVYSSSDSSQVRGDTLLLQQARKFKCECIQGSEMLYEQAIEQFQLWTQRTAPRQVYIDACLQHLSGNS